MHWMLSRHSAMSNYIANNKMFSIIAILKNNMVPK